MILTHNFVCFGLLCEARRSDLSTATYPSTESPTLQPTRTNTKSSCLQYNDHCKREPSLWERGDPGFDSLELLKIALIMTFMT